MKTQKRQKKNWRKGIAYVLLFAMLLQTVTTDMAFAGLVSGTEFADSGGVQDTGPGNEGNQEGSTSSPTSTLTSSDGTQEGSLDVENTESPGEQEEQEVESTSDSNSSDEQETGIGQQGIDDTTVGESDYQEADTGAANVIEGEEEGSLNKDQGTEEDPSGIDENDASEITEGEVQQNEEGKEEQEESNETIEEEGTEIEKTQESDSDRKSVV